MSKVSTFLQITLLAVLLLHLGVTNISFVWIKLLMYLMLAACMLSGLEYTWVWGRRAMGHLRKISPVDIKQ
jgi:cardiolipin synthase